MKHELPTSDRVAITIDSHGVAHVRLTRADKLNALDPAMFAALLEAGQALFDWPGLRAVVLSGEGRAFCAGLDLNAMAGLLETPLTERTHGNANRFQQAALQWRKLPVPVIAAIQGPCLGGGLQIAGGADIRIVAPDARLAVMEMKWGIVPDMGGFALWRGTVRDDILRELTYTNREFTGIEALALGFATIVDADPLGRAMALAAEIAARSPMRSALPKRCSTARWTHRSTRFCRPKALSSTSFWDHATSLRPCRARWNAGKQISAIPRRAGPGAIRPGLAYAAGCCARYSATFSCTVS